MKNSLDVIYEDNHLLVVNKPAGVVTQGAGPGQVGLVALAKDYLKQKYDKPGNVYLGIVSRLDSRVSGVIVLARTSKAAARLNQQFRDSTVEKTYWALVTGKLTVQQKTLENWLVKDESRQRMTVANGPQAEHIGKWAKLEYRVRGRYAGKTWLEIRLHTGRKHQIRVQLAECGNPIVGDRKYGSPVVWDAGIALHSHSLALDHPTRHERMVFQVPPPAGWNLRLYGLNDHESGKKSHRFPNSD